MKTFKEFINEAIPPHLSKFVKSAKVIDRTPYEVKNTIPDAVIVVARMEHDKTTQLLKKFSIRHSTSGKGSGTFRFQNDTIKKQALDVLKKNKVKIII